MTKTDTQRDVTLVAGPGRPPAGEGDLETMLTVALDGIIELSGASRGMIVLFGADGERILGKARTCERGDLDLAELEADPKVVAEVREQGMISFQSNALAHPVVLGMRSAEGLQPLAMGCFRDQDRPRTCGLVYLDRGVEGPPFTRQTLQLIEWLAQLVSVAINRRQEGTWRWRFLDATKRYSF
ncbi:MAG: GAF domain-containing protein [Acidobacteriota bacterium]